MKIVVLGPGCPNCRKLADNAETAARELGIDFELEKVTDITEITRYGVLMTPGLVIDGDVKSAGKVLSAKEIREIIQRIK